MDGITALGMMAGTLTTIAFIPQLAKAWRSKSTTDLAWGMVITFTMGVALWLLYGIQIDSLPVVVTNSVTLMLQLAIVRLKLRYG